MSTAAAKRYLCSLPPRSPLCPSHSESSASVSRPTHSDSASPCGPAVRLPLHPAPLMRFESLCEPTAPPPESYLCRQYHLHRLCHSILPFRLVPPTATPPGPTGSSHVDCRVPVIASTSTYDPSAISGRKAEPRVSPCSDIASPFASSRSSRPGPSQADRESPFSSLDEGIDMEDADESSSKCKTPHPRRTLYQCTWRGCQFQCLKVPLIEQHVRQTHLGPNKDSASKGEESDREEEFYYTEVGVEETSPTRSVSTLSSLSPVSMCGESPLLSPAHRSSMARASPWRPHSAASPVHDGPIDLSARSRLLDWRPSISGAEGKGRPVTWRRVTPSCSAASVSPISLCSTSSAYFSCSPTSSSKSWCQQEADSGRVWKAVRPSELASNKPNVIRFVGASLPQPTPAHSSSQSCLPTSAHSPSQTLVKPICSLPDLTALAPPAQPRCPQPRRRGRPPGSTNKRKQQHQPHLVCAVNPLSGKPFIASLADTVLPSGGETSHQQERGTVGAFSPLVGHFGGHLVAGKGLMLASRRSRGESRKCRKVYGMDNRHSWCTQCKWKKACSRFVD